MTLSIFQGRAARSLLITVGLLLPLAGGCDGQDSGVKIMKIGYVLPEGHPVDEAMKLFQRRAEELSHGEIEVRLYPNSQLGDAGELLASLPAGNAEAAVFSAAPVAQRVDLLNVVIMPFVFRDREHRFAMLDGEVGGKLEDALAEAGFHTAGWFDAGSRNIMTKDGPVRVPADLAGKKIRVMDSNALRLAVERLGASAVPMSQAEVYSALQTGVLDGWENNPATAVAFGMYETGCNKFAWTRHVAIPDVFLINKQWYDALTPEQRQAVDTAADEAEAFQRQAWQTAEDKAIATMKKAGVEFGEVDTEAFRSRFDGFYDQFTDKYGPEFADLLATIRDSGDETTAADTSETVAP